MSHHWFFSAAILLPLAMLNSAARVRDEATGAVNVFQSDCFLIAVGATYDLWDGAAATMRPRTGVAMPQAQQPSIVEQNRLVSARDAINGADWLKEQGVPTGLDQLDLGADSKGKPIKFQTTSDGTGVQIKLTGSALDNTLAGDKKSGPCGTGRKMKRRAPAG